MHEILPGIFHWITFHEGIEQDVHSYYIAATNLAVLIGPRVPEEGIKWFEKHKPPKHIYLTNRHHYRHSGQLTESFGTEVWCHKDGLHEFTRGEEVKPFNHGDELPGGILALNEKLAELTNLKRELEKLQNQWKVLKTIKEHKDEGICPQIESVIVRQKMIL